MREIIKLDGLWKLNSYSWNSGETFQPWSENFNDNSWITGRVPGDVHLDLLEAGKIEDPFWNRNADQCRWVEEMDWWYRKSFTVPENLLNSSLFICFDGLDCFATIYLNGELIGTHEDMFVECEFDITGKVKEDNILTVKLASPVKSVEHKDISHLNGNNHKQRVYARKCQMSYGWDFAPHLVTTGIWKSVRIESRDRVTVDNVFFQNKLVTKSYAEIEYEIVLQNTTNDKQNLLLQITGIPENFKGKTFADQQDVKLEPQEKRIITGKISVNQPRLWYPSTMGEPNLYNINISVLAGSTVVDQKVIRYGIRKVEILQKVEDAEDPYRFYFIVNGQPVFVKGANWVPPDAILARVTKEKYKKLLTMAKNANMNFLRVWGGGVTESDTFYDLCDEMGIMVWQEFNFACTDYPEDSSFQELVKYEVEKIVKRLRNRASLVMWCGSNETLWEHRFGAVLFYVTIRDICQRLDPERVYRYSSPFGGYWANAPEEGTEHFWYVWLGYKPYRYYKNSRGRFVSEFGMQSPAVLKTLESCYSMLQLSETSVQREMSSDTPPGPRPSLAPDCTDLQYHNSQTDKFQLYLPEFGDVKSIDDFIHLGQLMQATAVKYAVEHFRRRKYFCGGAVYWQLNDVWPSISWASIDYYLRPKMLYYFAKRFYAPVLVSFKDETDGLSVWITNDHLYSLTGNLTITFEEFTGKTLWKKDYNLTIEPDVSKYHIKIPENKLKNADNEKVFLWICFSQHNRKISENVYFPAEQRSLKLPVTSIHLIKKQIEETYAEITVTAAQYARLIKIEIPDEAAFAEDNFFDLRAGTQHTVKLTWDGDKKPKKLAVTLSAANAKPVRFDII